MHVDPGITRLAVRWRESTSCFKRVDRLTLHESQHESASDRPHPQLSGNGRWVTCQCAGWLGSPTIITADANEKNRSVSPLFLSPGDGHALRDACRGGKVVEPEQHFVGNLQQVLSRLVGGMCESRVCPKGDDLPFGLWTAFRSSNTHRATPRAGSCAPLHQ